VILAYDEAAIKARQIQDAVCEMEDKFRIIADSTPIAVMLYQDVRWIYANRAAETITGYSSKELFSMNFWDIVHPDHKALVQERGQKRQRGGRNNKSLRIQDYYKKWY
jgi:PAS domain S-box-containing protein